MPDLQITAAHGVTVKIGDGASPEVFNELLGVHNGPNGPGWEPQIIEARHHGSESVFRKVTLISKSPVTFDMYYDSMDTDHITLMTAVKAGTRKNYKITLTDTGVEVYSFAAYASATFKGDVSGFNVYSVTLNIDGDITVS